jgi:hypothetical protein
MTKLLCWLQILSLGALNAMAAPRDTAQKAATITLSVLDSFGHPRLDCHVVQFSSDAPFKKAEYKNRFSKYVGTNIPYAFVYTLLLRCHDGQTLGPKYITVGRPKEFFVIGQWQHFGDWVTGPDPRLAISVETDAETKLSGQAWVKVVGVYVDSVEVDEVDAQTHMASFYEIVPGRYLVMILDGDKIICTAPVEYSAEPESHAKIKLSVSLGGCQIGGLGPSSRGSVGTQP